MGFSIFRVCMTALICLGLLALFFFPSQFLARFSDALTETISDTERALLLGDMRSAQGLCAALVERVRADMPALERFLNHSDIDALDAAVSRAQCAARVGSAEEALEALTEADATLRRICGVELFSWNSLL